MIDTEPTITGRELLETEQVLAEIDPHLVPELAHIRTCPVETRDGDPTSGFRSYRVRLKYEIVYRVVSRLEFVARIPGPSQLRLCELLRSWRDVLLEMELREDVQQQGADQFAA